jgi:hypothetical protein
VLLVPGMLALLAGIDGGLRLLGVWTPVGAGGAARNHGVVMVMGFVGTLIAAERAVALGRRLGYAAPVALGAGGLAVLVPAADRVGATLVLIGAVALVGVYLPLWRRQRDDAVLVQALGAVLAVGGVLLWHGGAPVETSVPWFVGFLVLTIVGERLELARIGMPPGASTALVVAAMTLCSAVAAALLWPTVGAALLAVVLLSIVGWLATYDVARATVRGRGLPRFMAVSMLAGQAWLAVAALVWLVGGHVEAGPAYDAVVHAAFLGFAMSMVVAHAPVILPAVTRIRLPYLPAMYGPLALLHVSLVARIWVGDALGVETARELGGIGNALALVSFFAVVAWSAGRAARGGAR